MIDATELAVRIPIVADADQGAERPVKTSSARLELGVWDVSPRSRITPPVTLSATANPLALDL